MRNRSLDALFPKTRQAVLAATHGQPEKAWYASELARRIGVPPSSLQRELRNLVNADILRARRQGQMVYYQANVDAPLYVEIRGILLKTAGLVDVLAEHLKPLAPKINSAFVYGSIANGAEQSVSDVDLMIVGVVSPLELALPLRRAREVLGREINPTFYTPAEFDKKRLARDHFLTNVLGKPRLLVLGERDELEKVGGGRARNRGVGHGGRA